MGKSTFALSYSAGHLPYLRYLGLNKDPVSLICTPPLMAQFDNYGWDWAAVRGLGFGVHRVYPKQHLRRILRGG